jgi:hypothetical protein
MYISELTLMSQVIVNDIPVFLIVGIMIWLSHNGLSKKMDKMDKKYERVNQRLDNLYSELISLRKEIK